MVNTTYFYFFSPTGGTKKAGRIFCESISERVKMIDLGRRDGEGDMGTAESKSAVEVEAAEKVEGAGAVDIAENAESALTVIAAPVFSGRIPEFVAKKLKQLDGSEKKAVTLAVYGNRAYEDALLELNDVVNGQGFQVIASAALIAQHSMAPEVGKGRPDEADKREIQAFAQKVLEKIEANREDGGEAVKVPGNYPYREAKGMPVTPISLPACNLCGRCEKVCPTKAISIKEKKVETSAENCMLCMACTAVCPEHARILPPPLQEKMGQMLGALKDVRRENEFFL